MLTADQVAKFLQVSRDTVYELAARGELPARRMGRMWRFSEEGIEGFVRGDVANSPTCRSDPAEGQPTSAEALAEAGPDRTAGLGVCDLSPRDWEQCFRLLADNIAQVCWLTDWKKKELVYVNPAYETVYGRSRESLFAGRRSWLEVIHRGDRARVDMTFAENAERGAVTQEDYRIVHEDGSVRWIRDRAIPIRDESGAVVRFVGIADEITEVERNGGKDASQRAGARGVFGRRRDGNTTSGTRRSHSRGQSDSTESSRI